MRLKDKVAIVTGSGTGIGASIACAFAKEGAKVVLAGWILSDLEETAEKIRAIGGESLIVETDITITDQVKNMVVKTKETFGKIDILVNNAAASPPGGFGIAEVTEEDWDKVMNVDLRGAFVCCKYAVPEMIDQGKGKIINIASIAGLVAQKGLNVYSVAKAGIIQLTKQLALDHAREGINANCICPGYIDTQIIAPITMDEKCRETITCFFPINRIGKPEEIAHGAVYLASDEADYVTGAVLTIDGGVTCGAQEMFMDWQMGVQEVIKKYGEL